ncbi:MAG: sulfoxide reductase heme-binding subunit YedZ [Betaproteobacteria bacterium]|nr:sulfoxide reductase heme-binding subunit YedZ [Betaproteobacteria bacterium]
MPQPKPSQLTAIKAVLFATCLVPFSRLLYGAFANTLGANPIETISRSTGWWTLAFLMATLMVTPLRRITGMGWLLRLRRMLGLYAFFYACWHFTAFIWFDHWFDVMEIGKDVVKRPFVTVGFSAFVLLLPLAATSTDAMLRRLGRNWQRLHRLVYAIATLGVLHYWWLVKRDITEPLIFAAVLALLLGVRLAWRLREAPVNIQPSSTGSRS